MTGSGPRTQDYLEHILEAIERIQSYTRKIDLAAFLQNHLVQDGVIRNIEVIGEAANNVRKRAPEFAVLHPEVDWEAIYAMRNRIAHGYFQVDLDLVWKTLQNDLPKLEVEIRRLRLA